MEIEKVPIITFDDSARDRVLKALALNTNENQELIDESNKVLTNQDFESIKIKEFGGILMGSKIAIKKDALELAKYFVKKDK